MWICEEKSFFRRKSAYFSVFLPKSPAVRAIFHGKIARNSGFPIFPTIFPRLWKTSPETRQFSQYTAAGTVRAGKDPFSKKVFHFLKGRKIPLDSVSENTKKTPKSEMQSDFRKISRFYRISHPLSSAAKNSFPKQSTKIPETEKC